MLGPSSSFRFDVLAPVFLSLAEEKEDLIRASAMSSLAELCEVAGSKMISAPFQEMLYCVEQALQYDSSQLVRRAAVSLLRSMLHGSNESMLMLFRGNILAVYRLLKKLAADDTDATVQLHAELCIRDLDENMNSITLEDTRPISGYFLL